MSSDPQRNGQPTAAGSIVDDDERLVEALRAGDEGAFTALVERYHPALVRLARAYVPNEEVAEEVAQETWVGVLRGIDRFEGRSSFKTWLFRILVNRAQTRGKREARTVPFSSLASDEAASEEAPIEADRFFPAEHERSGHWTDGPRPWDGQPEDRLLSSETLGVVRDAIENLPPAQKTVITLRDIEHWPSEDVRNALDISETNQRVLLHRARSKVRKALEEYFESTGADRRVR